MIKPNVAYGQEITQEMCDHANDLKLSKSCVRRRIKLMHLSAEEACTMPKIPAQERVRKLRESWNKQIIPSQDGLTRYFLTPEELQKRYGHSSTKHRQEVIITKDLKTLSREDLFQYTLSAIQSSKDDQLDACRREWVNRDGTAKGYYDAWMAVRKERGRENG